MGDVMDMVRFVEDFEEIEAIIRRFPAPRRILRDSQNPLEFYREEEFKVRYRFDKRTAVDSLALFEEELRKENRRGLPIPPIIQLLVSLRYYATGNFQLVSADLRGISPPSVSRIIQRISVLIARLRPQFVKFPTEAERRNNAREVFNRSRFPGVVGANDGTHVPILNLGGDHAEVFRNRKGFFSFNCQGIVDHNRTFVDFVTSWPGSTHNNRIFNNSRICLQFERDQRLGMLVGDSGYACRPFLMTPLLNPATLAEEAYNASHILARNVVGRTFGCWKKKFQYLAKKLTLKLNNVPVVIVATVVLHNIAADRGLLEKPDEREHDVDEADCRPPPHVLGAVARRNLIHRYFN